MSLPNVSVLVREAGIFCFPIDSRNQRNFFFKSAEATLMLLKSKEI